MNKQVLIIGGVAVASAGAGFGAGYVVFKKRFEKYAEEEIQSVKEAYRKNGVPKPDSPLIVQKNDAPEAAYTEPITTDQSIISEAGYSADDNETDSDIFRRAHGRVPSQDELVRMGSGESVGEVIRHPSQDADDHVMEGDVTDPEYPAQPDPEMDLADALDATEVDESNPFVIESILWYSNNLDYDQVSLVYWADDDVLAADDHRIITDVDEYIGRSNLLGRWGVMSDNPDIVYVRNHAMKTDFEIIKDERNYSEIVRNITTDQNEPTRIRRMRDDG